MDPHAATRLTGHDQMRNGRNTRVRDRASGFTTPQFVLAAGLALMFFVFLANMIVFQYGKGVVRGALNEGVRAGARSGVGLEDCERALVDTLGDLLGGSMGAGVTASCSSDGVMVSAHADVTFPSWIPGVPDWSFTLTAQSVEELSP